MASIINAATSGGLITTADTSGILQLQTAGTTAVTVNASQNVGIGTTNFAAGKLSVLGRMGAFNTTGANDSLIQIWNNGTTSNIASSYSSTGAYAPLTFLTSDVERARIPTAGGFQSVGSISVGNATPTTSGAGITFPATQSASTDANTLDDYEEGTFTPTLTNDGFTRTYNSQYTAGNYVKVGRTVTVNVVMLVSSQTGTYNSAVPRFNLPFAVYNTATSMRWGTFVCRMSGVPNNTPISKICTVQLQSNNFNALDFLYYNASTTFTDNSIDTTGWSGYQIGFTVTYTADA